MMRGLAVWAMTAVTVSASCFQTQREAARAASMPVVQGEEPWLFLPAELSFLGKDSMVSEAAPPEHRDPLLAIEDFDQQLRQAGSSLLVVPVPPKAFVEARRLGCTSEETAAVAARLAGFYGQLRERGVAVLDLAADFLAATNSMYCRTDTHWSGHAIQRAAAAISMELANSVAAREPSPFRVVEREIEFTGDLVKMGGPGGTERLTLGFVEDAVGQPVAADTNSPLLLLGDSHVLVFHAGADLHARGAGLPDHLAAALGQSVDVLGVRGSGATTARISLMRRVRANPDYLAGKKVVVWCFAAREFTEADGWRKVTLRP